MFFAHQVRRELLKKEGINIFDCYLDAVSMAYEHGLATFDAVESVHRGLRDEYSQLVYSKKDQELKRMEELDRAEVRYEKLKMEQVTPSMLS